MSQQHVPGQRVAVGVQARTSPCATSTSPGRTRSGPQHRVGLDDPDAGGRQVVAAVRHQARVLGGLAAQQRAAGLPAAVGDARDDRRDLLRARACRRRCSPAGTAARPRTRPGRRRPWRPGRARSCRACPRPARPRPWCRRRRSRRPAPARGSGPAAARTARRSRRCRRAPRAGRPSRRTAAAPRRRARRRRCRRPQRRSWPARIRRRASAHQGRSWASTAPQRVRSVSSARRARRRAPEASQDPHGRPGPPGRHRRRARIARRRAGHRRPPACASRPHDQVLEQVLAEQRLLGQRDRVVAVEAGRAQPGARLLAGRDQARRARRSRAMSAPIERRTPSTSSAAGHQLGAGGEVDAVEARPAHGRRGDPHVHLERAGLAQHPDQRALGVAAHDRVVHHDQPLAADDVAQRVELEPDAELADGLRRAG